jgi:hypothetical protein
MQALGSKVTEETSTGINTKCLLNIHLRLNISLYFLIKKLSKKVILTLQVNFHHLCTLSFIIANQKLLCQVYSGKVSQCTSHMQALGYKATEET